MLALCAVKNYFSETEEHNSPMAKGTCPQICAIFYTVTRIKLQNSCTAGIHAVELQRFESLP